MHAAVLAAACLAVSYAAAGAYAGQAPGAAKRYAHARALIKRIPKAAFAAHRRDVLLGVAKAGLRPVRGRYACPAIVAVDRLVSALGIPTNWRRGHLPRSARKPRILLKQAARALLRRAGPGCAKPTKVTVALKPSRGGVGLTPVPGPAGAALQDVEEEEETEPVPAGVDRPPGSIGAGVALGRDPFGGGEGSPRGLRAAPRALGDAPGRVGAAAVDPLRFFRIAEVGIPPRDGCCPYEPTAAEGGNVVWYTGNNSVALSTDAGRTFKTFDPSKIVPDLGRAFCCDQVVSYSPQYDVFVWILQYMCGPGTTDPPSLDCPDKGTTSNRLRIAVASPADLRAHAASPGPAWTFWDLTPQLFGQPAGAWFDFGDIAVNAWNLQLTVNMPRGNVNALLARVSLAALRARGAIGISFFTDGAVMRIAQGAYSSTSYYAGSTSLSKARIFSWRAFSDTAVRHDIDHASLPTANGAIRGTDGVDWYMRFPFPGAVSSATVSGDTLYLAQATGRDQCTANCGTSTPTLRHVFDQPAIFVSTYDVNAWRLKRERWLWNPTIGFGYPALQVNEVGEVGIALRASADGQNAQPVAGFLTPAEQLSFVIPAGTPFQAGDYYSLRPGRTPRSFVMTTQTEVDVGDAAKQHWGFAEYGHGAPPYVSPPSVHITAPANLAVFPQGATAAFSAAVSDPIDGTLPRAAIRWTEDGTFIGDGAQITRVASSPGTHVIAVKATNGDGRSASDAITIRVQPPPSALQVAIASPLDNSTYGGPFDEARQEYCVAIGFSAAVTGAAGPLSYSWTDIRDGGLATEVSTELSPTLSLCAGYFFNVTVTHDLTLRVTDGVNTSTAQVRVKVVTPYIG